MFWDMPPNLFERWWINDANPDPISVYLALQADHSGAFRRSILVMRECYSTKDLVQNAFDYFRGLFKSEQHTPEQYLFLSRYALGAMVTQYRRNGASIAAARRGTMRGNRDGMMPITKERLDWCYDRLQQNVKITCGDFAALLDAPAEHGAVWEFLDPTYPLTAAVHHGQPIYGKELTIAEHVKLAADLKRCQHRWLMTISNSKLVYQLYKEADGYQSPYRQEPGLRFGFLPMTYGGVPRMQNVNGSKKHRRRAPRVKELTIRNYDD